MKKWCLLLLGAPVLLLGNLGAGPVTDKVVVEYKLEPGEVKTYEGIKFRGQERACVILIGERDTPLWLTVRDAKGSLVARDAGRGSDDRAVIWYPPRDGAYTIVVQNPAETPNHYFMAIR
jgi:hypothetical protein